MQSKEKLDILREKKKRLESYNYNNYNKANIENVRNMIEKNDIDKAYIMMLRENSPTRVKISEESRKKCAKSILK